MSVVFQLQIFSTLAIFSGLLLLTKPEWLLRSPLEPYLTYYTGLPSTTINRGDLTLTAIPIMAIGVIYACSVWSGDDKFVRVSGKRFHTVCNERSFELCMDCMGISEIDGSAGEVVFRRIRGGIVDVHGIGEYGLVDFGGCGFWVCHVVGEDNWVWGGS